MEVNGIPCVTYGDEIKQKNVNHGYFGSKQIVHDLMHIEGYDDGLICI